MPTVKKRAITARFSLIPFSVFPVPCCLLSALVRLPVLDLISTQIIFRRANIGSADHRLQSPKLRSRYQPQRPAFRARQHRHKRIARIAHRRRILQHKERSWFHLFRYPLVQHLKIFLHTFLLCRARCFDRDYDPVSGLATALSGLLAVLLSSRACFWLASSRSLRQNPALAGNSCFFRPCLFGKSVRKYRAAPESALSKCAFSGSRRFCRDSRGGLLVLDSRSGITGGVPWLALTRYDAPPPIPGSPSIDAILTARPRHVNAHFRVGLSHQIRRPHPPPASPERDHQRVIAHSSNRLPRSSSHGSTHRRLYGLRNRLSL